MRKEQDLDQRKKLFLINLNLNLFLQILRPKNKKFSLVSLMKVKEMYIQWKFYKHFEVLNKEEENMLKIFNDYIYIALINNYSKKYYNPNRKI